MRLISPQLLFSFQSRNSQRSGSLLLSMLFDTVYHNYTSCNMNVWPTPAATFFQLMDFWPGQCEEVIDNLLLLPDAIVCAATYSTSSKQLAIFLLLRQWNKADTWDDVRHVLRRGRVWCIKIYRAVCFSY